jgi:hypothetical protein
MQDGAAAAAEAQGREMRTVWNAGSRAEESGWQYMDGRDGQFLGVQAGAAAHKKDPEWIVNRRRVRRLLSLRVW